MYFPAVYMIKSISSYILALEILPLSFAFQLSATNSMHAELIEDDGESRYKVTDIIGK